MKEDFFAIAISFFEKTTHQRVSSIRPLGGGTANAVFLVNLDKVVRIKRPNQTDELFYSPGREYETILALNGMTPFCPIPKAYIFDPHTGNKVEAYVFSPEFKSHKGETFKRYQSCLETLKVMHRCQAALPSFRPIERFKRYKFLSAEEIRKDYEEEVLAKAIAAFKVSPVVFCHNDLHAANFVLEEGSGKTRLLDLEMAGYNFEVFDLASLISENNLDETMAIRLIHAFYGIDNVTDKTIEMVKDVMRFEDLLWSYWAKARFLETIDQVFLDIAKEKMSHIARSMRKRFG